MATKDYVKRGRSAKSAPTKAKSSPSKKRKKTTPAEFPAKWAVVAVFSALGLITGLFFVTKDKVITEPELQPKTAIVTPVVTTPKVSKNESPLPPKPEEKWRYIQELENKKVIVPVLTPKQVAAADKPVRPYLLQCGAYHTRAQAEKRKAMVAFQGLNSQIKVSTNDKGTWYRVVLGPYKNKRLAMDDQNKLQQHGVGPCAIWFWK